MAVAWTMLANWGPLQNSGAWQTNYWRIPFAGQPHIVASAYINVLSSGTLNGVAGEAMATFKRFEYMDANGIVQEQELTEAVAFIEVERCVSITVALDMEASFVCAGWSFHTLT